MRKHIVNFLGTACLLVALGTTAPATQTASAQQENSFLSGSYAVQFTGSLFLPAPFNTFNGPFARNGRVYFDGQGNMTANVVANYNGSVQVDQFSGTYVVNTDLTFVITINNIPVPAFPPGTPNTFTFSGVLADNGHQAKLLLSGISLFGQVQANLGNVITGELIKQFHP